MAAGTLHEMLPSLSVAFGALAVLTAQGSRCGAGVSDEAKANVEFTVQMFLCVVLMFIALRCGATTVHSIGPERPRACGRVGGGGVAG